MIGKKAGKTEAGGRGHVSVIAFAWGVNIRYIIGLSLWFEFWIPRGSPAASEKETREE